MLSFDDAATYLDEILDTLPVKLLRELNGGVSLTEALKFSDDGSGMCVLGQYFKSRQMGRYILIYYGSFVRVYKNASDDVWRKRLKEVLVHELTHHNQSLAGVSDLEVKDAIQKEHYKNTGIFTPTRDIDLFKKDR